MEHLIRIGKGITGLFVPLAFFLSLAHTQTFSCTPTAVGALVRSEGLAERVGDIVIDCSGGAPGATIKGNLTVFLNAKFTNKLLANNTTDVLLYVDTGAGPQLVSVPAELNGSTAVAFNGVTFTIPASGKVA